MGRLYYNDPKWSFLNYSKQYVLIGLEGIVDAD